MDKEIKPGDVIVLKSDTEHKLKMTVRSVDKNYSAECYYADSNTFQIKKMTVNSSDVPVILLTKLENESVQ